MFRKRKNLKFCGCDHEKLEKDVLRELHDLKNDIVLTNQELFAMDIAIMAVTAIADGMIYGGKVEYD